MSVLNKPTGISRRSFLKLGGLLGMAPLGSPPVGDLLADSPPRPLRHPASEYPTRVVPLPPLPETEVIALNRLAFGPRPGDLQAFRSLGSTPQQRLQVWVDQQLNPVSINDSDCDTRLASGFSTLNKSLAQLWLDHVVNENQGWEYRMLPLIETERATWIRAVYSKRQLQEVLADFWHNHFNVYGWHYYVGPVMVHYDRDVIRANMLGNFRQMLEAVAKSTAMLFYLDNYLNQAGGFNENWARELLELHTLGAENYLGVMDPFSVPLDENGVPIGYVDNDVYEAARCFTGWRVDYSSWEPGVGETGLFLYYSSWHDRANKFFMRQYMPADQAPLKDGLDVLDMIASHPGTARHIAGKLCRRLLSDNPPQDVIDTAAGVFLAQKDAPDQLKQVVRSIVVSDAFMNTWGDKIKRPFEIAAGMLRAMNASFTPTDSFGWSYDGMGQELFSHAAPNGYPDDRADWQSTMSMLHRWRLCNHIIESWLEGTSVDLAGQMPADIRTPNAIADFWIQRLLGRPMHPAENRNEIVEFVAMGRNPDYDLPADLILERVPRMAALILMAPDFQLR
jgi:uncharacterized protein (DUF1800 family)